MGNYRQYLPKKSARQDARPAVPFPVAAAILVHRSVLPPLSLYTGRTTLETLTLTYQLELGHMRRAMREITELVQSHKLDLIIETRDARLPLTSINPAFERLLAEQAGRGIGAGLDGGKGIGTTKRLIVYNKADLAQDCFQIVKPRFPFLSFVLCCEASTLTRIPFLSTLEQPLQRAFAQHDEDQVLFTDSRSDQEVKQVLEAAISCVAKKPQTSTHGLRT